MGTLCSRNDIHLPTALTQCLQLFFSRALTTATKADIQTVFSQYGQVLEVVPFLVSKGSTFTRVRDGMPCILLLCCAAPVCESNRSQQTWQQTVLLTPSCCQHGLALIHNRNQQCSHAPVQGCGLVMMSSQQEATAAIEGLNSKYTWAGKDRPMVVVPLDITLQERRRNSTGTTTATGMGLGLGQKMRADSLPLAAQVAMADALSSMDLGEQHRHPGGGYGACSGAGATAVGCRQHQFLCLSCLFTAGQQRNAGLRQHACMLCSQAAGPAATAQVPQYCSTPVT